MRLQLFLTLALIASPSAFAEKTLQECIDTENDLERLVCYDSIFGPSKGAIPTSLPSTSNQNDFGAEKLKGQPSSLRSEVLGNIDNVELGDNINLTNGQVWKVVDPRIFRYKAKTPSVTISKGAFGSYFLKFLNRNREIKVKRIK